MAVVLQDPTARAVRSTHSRPGINGCAEILPQAGSCRKGCTKQAKQADDENDEATNPMKAAENDEADENDEAGGER